MALATGLFVIAAAAPSFALSAPNFAVHNLGTTPMIDLRVAPSKSDDWGDNLLDAYDDELDPNHFVYALKGYNLPSCVQDVRATYEDGHVEYFYNLNVCNKDVNFYY